MSEMPGNQGEGVSDGLSDEERSKMTVEQGGIPFGFDFDDLRQKYSTMTETLMQVYDRVTKTGEIVAGNRGGNFAYRGQDGKYWFCSQSDEWGARITPIKKRENMEGKTSQGTES